MAREQVVFSAAVSSAAVSSLGCELAGLRRVCRVRVRGLRARRAAGLSAARGTVVVCALRAPRAHAHRVPAVRDRRAK